MRKESGPARYHEAENQSACIQYIIYSLFLQYLVSAGFKTRLIYKKTQCAVPVEVHLVNFRVVVLDLSVNMADDDGEVGQAALHREGLGKAADVVANAVHQTLYI